MENKYKLSNLPNKARVNINSPILNQGELASSASCSGTVANTHEEIELSRLSSYNEEQNTGEKIKERVKKLVEEMKDERP